MSARRSRRVTDRDKAAGFAPAARTAIDALTGERASIARCERASLALQRKSERTRFRARELIEQPHPTRADILAAFGLLAQADEWLEAAARILTEALRQIDQVDARLIEELRSLTAPRGIR